MRFAPFSQALCPQSDLKPEACPIRFFQPDRRESGSALCWSSGNAWRYSGPANLIRQAGKSLSPLKSISSLHPGKIGIICCSCPFRASGELFLIHFHASRLTKLTGFGTIFPKASGYIPSSNSHSLLHNFLMMNARSTEDAITPFSPQK